MFSSLRTRFGIPGVISVIALVFAMLGGAYAANDNSGDGNATASAKPKKGATGPRGPKGATGPAGPQGPAGANGAKGDTGSAGGTGPAGKSVETGNATVGECPNGGATVQVAGEAATKKKVCNGAPGANGTDGEDGSPWTAGGTLPPGETETGAWGGQVGAASFFGTASFAIPLAAELDQAHAIGIKAGGPVPGECEDATHPGTASAANPEAEPGYLCVYVGIDPGASPNSPLIFKTSALGQKGASTTGALVQGGTTAGFPYVGTFAVTAPVAP